MSPAQSAYYAYGRLRASEQKRRNQSQRRRVFRDWFAPMPTRNSAGVPTGRTYGRRCPLFDISSLLSRPLARAPRTARRGGRPEAQQDTCTCGGNENQNSVHSPNRAATFIWVDSSQRGQVSPKKLPSSTWPPLQDCSHPPLTVHHCGALCVQNIHATPAAITCGSTPRPGRQVYVVLQCSLMNRQRSKIINPIPPRWRVPTLPHARYSSI